MTIPSVNLELANKNHIYQKLFSGGKGLRAKLTQETADCLNIPAEQQKSLGRIVEYIHQSSLLHDDVIDVSPLRRGQLSGWRRYSMRKAVLAGDYLLAESAEKAADLNNIPLIKLTAQTLKQLVKGEWLQAEIKDKENTEDLEKVHELKTAPLFQWSLKAPFLLKNYYDEELHSRLNEIGRLLGLLFQRADDLLDFDIRNKEGKTTFKDLEEGTLNVFAVHLTEQIHHLKPVDMAGLNQTDSSTVSYEKGKGKGKGATLGGFSISKVDKNRENHALSSNWGSNKASIKSCRSLKEVKKLIGDKTFDKALMDFDKISEQKIRACQDEVDQLGKILSRPAPAQAGSDNGADVNQSASFIQQAERFKAWEKALKKWPEKLYWRK